MSVGLPIVVAREHVAAEPSCPELAAARWDDAAATWFLGLMLVVVLVTMWPDVKHRVRQSAQRWRRS